ncbi:PEP-CTERM sorting domain-containing protein [bacterium]|nr:MAG: PEP-CTERM sorting domain-containing protein [bacterium]
MGAVSPRAIAVASTLVGTWAVANANPVTVDYTTTLQIDNTQVFTESYSQGTSAPGDLVPQPGPYVTDSATIAGTYGTLGAASTGAFDFDITDYNDGTSTYAGIVGTSGDTLVFGLSNVDATLAEAYLESASGEGQVFDDVSAAILSGDAGRLHELYAMTPFFGEGISDLRSSNGFNLTNLDGFSPELGTYSFSFYSFSREGSEVSTTSGIGGGTYTVNAVPEPASMAALGFGALALLRRRRKA